MLPYTASGVYCSATQITTTPIDETARSKSEQLEIRLERANLIMQTLLMILLEKQIIHEDEFREWMVYVDELDGARDGRIRADNSPVQCPKCHRMSPRTATKCLYCGQIFEVEFLARRPPAMASPGGSPPPPPSTPPGGSPAAPLAASPDPEQKP